MARNRTVIRIFWRSSLILKMVIRRLWARPWNVLLTAAVAEAMVVLPERAPARRLRLGGVGGCYGCCLGGRGFILFRLGFFGGGITSAVPPRAVIFSAADFEKWCARTTSRLLNSP